MKSVFAQSPSQSFNYQGRILNAEGSAGYGDVVDFTLSIYDPTGSCLLYEESQSNIDVSETDGIFSLEVGSLSGSTKRSLFRDPNLSMARVFANTSQQIRAPGDTNCTAGYSPAASDYRLLRVTITSHSTMIGTTLTPDLKIHSVPFATVAETLQGMGPSEFIQVTSSSGGSVSQAGLEGLTSGADVGGSLHNHDSLYVKVGSSSGNVNLNGSFNLVQNNTLGLGNYSSTQQSSLIADLTSNSSTGGKTWYNSSTNQVYYWDGSAARQLAVAGSASAPITYDSNTGVIGISSAPTFTNMTLSGLNSVGLVRTNSSGNLSTSALSASEITTALGFTPLNKAGEVIHNSSSFHIQPSSDIVSLLIQGNASQSQDLTQWKDNAGTALASINSAGKLTVKNLMITGGTPGLNKILTSDASGNASWQDIPAPVATVGATSPISSSVSGATTTVSIQKADSTHDGYLSQSDFSAFNSKEPAISAGTTLQYWRGDKSWAPLTEFRAELSGTAPITYDSSTGVIAINSTPTFAGMTLSGLNASGFVRTNASGNLSTSALSSSDINSALGFTPVSSAGGTLSGPLELPSNGLTVGTNQLAVRGGNVGIGTTSPTQALTVAGTIESTSGGFKFPDASVQTTAVSSIVGEVSMFAGSTAPSGWRICDGSAISRTTYSALFAVIGTTYGVGDGSTTFNLPDLQGRVAMGAGSGSGLTSRAIAGKVGEENHTLTLSEMPSHDHGGSTGNPSASLAHSHSASGTFRWDSSAGTNNGQIASDIRGNSSGSYGYSQSVSVSVNNSGALSHNHTISAQGGGTGHNVVQPSLVVNYIIRVQ